MEKVFILLFVIWSSSVFGQNKKQYEGYYKYDTVETSVMGIGTTPANSKKFDMLGDARILGSTADNTAAMLMLRASNNGVRFFFRNDGNFGIGTESPQTQLENVMSGVSTILRNTSTGSYNALSIYNDQNSSSRAFQIAYTGSAYGSSYLTSGVTGEQGIVTTSGAFPLLLGTSNTLRMIINSSGAVGVGTNAPDSKSLLDLTSTTLGFLAPRMTTTQRNAITSPPTGLMIFNTTDSSYQQYRGLSGWSSLGAGAGGTPGGSDREIQINNAGSFGTQTWKISSSGELSNVSDQGDFKIQVDGNVFQQGTTSDGSATLHRWTAANGGNRMWLWSDGHLGFNSSVYPEATLTVIGETLPMIFRASSAGSYSRIQARNDQNSSSRSFDYGYTGSSYGAFWTSGTSGEQGILGTTGNFPITIATNNTQRMSIAGDGTITMASLAGTGSRNVLADANGVLSAPVSDFSVKKNIRSLEYGLSTIMKLNPVSFEYKDGWKSYGQGKQIGFIAQDIKEVLPNSAFITPATGKMGYNEIDLVPVLVKAVQEQQLEIEELKKEVRKLKRK